VDKELDLPYLLRSRLTMVATNVALQAGAVIKRYFEEKVSFQVKQGVHDVVTEIDKKVEALIIEAIRGQFPDHGFVAEESGKTGGVGGIQWVIDPIDGTLNYVRKIPIFSTSIAAVFPPDILAGVVYQPMSGELFIAEKGHGAYLNGERLKVSSRNMLDQALLATGFPYNVNENPYYCLDHFDTFAKIGVSSRKMGSAALDLAYVAAGRYDAFWAVSLYPWDYAAGKLLLEESGGQFTDFYGHPYTKLVEGSVVASNHWLHEPMVRNMVGTLDRTQRHASY